MASRPAITTELSMTLTLFNRRVDEEELAVLALAWEEAFADINDDELRSGCKAARRRCRFFPAPAEILEAVETGRQTWRPARAALPSPERLDPEKRWRNMIMAKTCLHSIMRKCDKNLARQVLDTSKPWGQREPLARKCLGRDFVEFKPPRRPEQEISRG